MFSCVFSTETPLHSSATCPLSLELFCHYEAAYPCLRASRMDPTSLRQAAVMLPLQLVSTTASHLSQL